MSVKKSIKVLVDKKPYPISVEMRPIWRISLLVISIAVTGKDKDFLDVTKVNILVWMLIRKNRWSEYEDYLLDRGDDIPLISVDTATFKAVEIAIEKGYFKMESDRLYLLDKGKELLNVLKENEIMEDQIEFLERLGKKLTVSKVKGLTELTVSEQVNSSTKEIYLLNKQIDQNTPKVDGINAQLGYVNLLRGKCESLFNSIESSMLPSFEIKLKIQTLEYDYDQYLQLRRLEKVGANIDGGVEIKKCPICESELFDTLGSQNVDIGPMSLETNIQFLKNQIDFYTLLHFV